MSAEPIPKSGTFELEAKTLELVKLIGAEVALFEQFLQTLNRQQEALVANNLDLLQESTRGLEDLTLETKKAEAQRQELVASLSVDLNINQDDINLSRLARLVSEPESNELSRLQDTLLDLHRQIMETKSRNEFLIKKSMEYLDTTLSYITGSAGEKAIYRNGDEKPKRKSQSLSLDRRA